MNTIYRLMLIDNDRLGTELPDPALSIYDAFDAAEWLQGDPIETVTRPAIGKLLNEADHMPHGSKQPIPS